MPREVIFLQVGQCGNQIGSSFWNLLLREHASIVRKRLERDLRKKKHRGYSLRKHSPSSSSLSFDARYSPRFPSSQASHTSLYGEEEGTSGWGGGCFDAADASSMLPVPLFDESMGVLFRNVDCRRGLEVRELGGEEQPIKTLKARAILIDMEEGVLNQILRSPLASLFDEKQFIADVSGSGNNWCHGYCAYGPQYRERLQESLHRALEQSESPQSFLLLHSLGGGTGSGLGTYILQRCEESVSKRGFYGTKRRGEEQEIRERRSLREGGEEEKAWNPGMTKMKGIALTGRGRGRNNACSFFHRDAFEDMNLLIASLLSDLTRYLSLYIYICIQL
ncbi:tubulin gtpase domain-containing protein [Cystoisospora suis]|uniref:Tubulin gtpase domain-containing protein n=1 Tax=Cystoisospora suis TaxID=483139 RepID=A0A2C6LCZ7_9APIC|nr:tubulin gtpase domain-containing protein [Cystoisospora suis]